MSARPRQRATKPRRVALLCGATGWAVVLALAIARIALGAPRETGVLVVILVNVPIFALTGVTRVADITRACLVEQQQ